jgi:glutathionylspermidine synthase
MRKISWLSGLTLEEVKKASSDFWSHLSEHAYPVSRGTIRIPISLEPFEVTAQEYEMITTQVSSVLSAAAKLANAYASDEALRKVLALHEGERELIDASLGEPLVGVVRVDLFHSLEPKMIEINADFPDGFFMHDVTAMRIASSHGAIQSVTPPSHADLHIALLREEGVGEDAHIYIGYNKGREFVDEFELTRQRLIAAGWSTVSIGAIEDLEFSGGDFSANGKKIDVLKRGCELSKLRHSPELLQNLLMAQQRGLKIFNNFKLRLLGHKALMAALWDERFVHYLTDEELLAVRHLVPQTFKLEQHNVEEVLNDKDAWVLKPTDLAEGKGVCVGSSMTQREWIEALEGAHPANSWILQRKVTIPKETFTLYHEDTGKIHSAEAHYDLDPHVVLFRDKIEMGNMLVRFSSSEVLNVMQGGGITYALKKP